MYRYMGKDKDDLILRLTRERDRARDIAAIPATTLCECTGKPLTPMTVRVLTIAGIDVSGPALTGNADPKARFG